DRLFPQLVHDGVKRVVIAVGTGEGHDAEFHEALTPATSKSSVTGLARSFSHIARASFSAAALSLAESSTITCRPTWTSFTHLKPACGITGYGTLLIISSPNPAMTRRRA